MNKLQSKVDALPKLAFAGLNMTTVPASPGVCLFFQNGKWVFVGKGKKLNARLAIHADTSPDLSRSALRRSICQHLKIAKTTVTSKKPAQLTDAKVEPVNTWINQCQVAWIVCDSEESSKLLKKNLITLLDPVLNKIK
jgi:excinuclease UvrABC nuclease subunit